MSGPKEPTPPVLGFGPFRFDREQGLLRRDDAEIRLPPRVAALLDRLLETPGRVVSHDELVIAVWREAHVGDASLAEAVSQLRAALGDDSKRPRYVETVHRRGYRFRAAVEPAPGAPEPGASPVPSATVAPLLPEPGGRIRLAQGVSPGRPPSAGPGVLRHRPRPAACARHSQPPSTTWRIFSTSCIGRYGLWMNPRAGRGRSCASPRARQNRWKAGR